MINLQTAFSSCPNDTFIFHAMIHGLVDTKNFKFKEYISDVEELNTFAMLQKFPITKLSFHAYLHLKKHYTLLNSGAALGHGCGPLLISKDQNLNLEKAKIAIPGEYTTANMLMKLWNPHIKNTESVRFDEIMPGILSGKYDAGLIIHESRFIYQDLGLSSIIDLGQWWESETSMPIPLGCIALRNDQLAHLDSINSILHSSIDYAFNNKTASDTYIKNHAQELKDSIIDSHIDLYVNKYSLNLGEEGLNAIKTLEKMAKDKNIL